MSIIELEDDHFCFACGERNPDGLRLKFTYPAKGQCRAEFLAHRKYQGWRGILHGGIVATLLDEAIAHAVGGPERGAGDYGVTAEMTVRYLKAVPIGQKVFLEGRVLADKGKVIDCAAVLKDDSGRELARASGMIVRKKKSPGA
jgi:uncharacterized protein (TIGR00369 family)